MKIGGIDEAGRGPVIGPMVLCGVVIDEEKEPLLREIGAKDSKLTTRIQRERLYLEITKIVKYEVVIVEADEIDKALNSTDGMNLNWLEAVKCAEIINKLNPDTIYLDCPSPNIPAYTKYVQKLLKTNSKLVCAHHADRDHLTVSAASIIAKVIRDREVSKIEQTIGEKIGSGYAADPITQVFMKKHWKKYPDIFRKSWSSYKNLKEVQKTLMEES